MQQKNPLYKHINIKIHSIGKSHYLKFFLYEIWAKCGCMFFCKHFTGKLFSPKKRFKHTLAAFGPVEQLKLCLLYIFFIDYRRIIMRNGEKLNEKYISNLFLMKSWKKCQGYWIFWEGWKYFKNKITKLKIKKN